MERLELIHIKECIKRVMFATIGISQIITLHFNQLFVIIFNLLMMYVNLSDIAFSNIKGSDYCLVQALEHCPIGKLIFRDRYCINCFKGS